MEHRAASMSLIQNWQRMCSSTPNNNDSLVPVISKGMDAMSTLLDTNASHNDFDRALRSFDLELQNAEQGDIGMEHNLMYGFARCVHATLGVMSRDRFQSISGHSQIRVKTEPIYATAAYSADIAHEESSAERGDGQIPVSFPLPSRLPTVRVKRETDEDQSFGMYGEEIYPLFENLPPGAKIEADEEEAYASDEIDPSHPDFFNFDSPEADKTDVSIADSEMLSTVGGPISPVQGGGVSLPRAMAVKESKRPVTPVKRQAAKRGICKKKGLFGCTRCTWHNGNSPSTVITHLRNVHGETPTTAGIYFRCVCGFESRSHNHSRSCKLNVYKMIKDTDEPFAPKRVYKNNLAGRS